MALDCLFQKERLVDWLALMKEALELAIKELEESAQMLGEEGYFTRYRHIVGYVIPKLREALPGNGQAPITDE